MIKQYEKDGDFCREIEVKWNEHDNVYEITKRNISGRNSQGHSVQFTPTELRYLKSMITEII